MKRTTALVGFIFLTVIFMGCNSSEDSINYARWNQRTNQKVDAYRASGEFGDSPSDQNYMDPDALNEANDDINLVKLIKYGVNETEK